MQPIRIGLIGAGRASETGRELAHRVGELVALRHAVLVCGGMGGVMEAGSRGCTEAGGTVVGILPGDAAEQGNPFITIPIVTDLGHARNVLIAQTAQALIAVEGEYGTLSEIAISLKLGKRVICLGGWEDIPGVQSADSPEEAVNMALASVEEG